MLVVKVDNTNVMHVRFTFVCVLDRNFEILILRIDEETVQSEPVKSAILISLNLAVS